MLLLYYSQWISLIFYLLFFFFFAQVWTALAEWGSLKNVSNLVAKRQIYTCASNGEGCSLEKPNDCLRAGRQCLSRWWSTCQSSPMSVPSLFVCLHTSLPLAFFLLSLFLPFLFLSPLSFLAPSCLLPFLSLCFFSQQSHVSFSYHGVVRFTTIPTAPRRVNPSTYSVYYWQ